jgi:hypothetical protein
MMITSMLISFPTLARMAIEGKRLNDMVPAGLTVGVGIAILMEHRVAADLDLRAGVGCKTIAMIDPVPGQSCPPHYRYRPADFRGPASLHADTVYVIGGLYGNPEALRTILSMQAEEARRGIRVALVFNGDHHWFDVDPAWFRKIDAEVLTHCAIRGNVETELAAETDAGCGCNYPDYVDAVHVARSNAIMTRLRAVARQFSQARAALGALPMFRTIEVGPARIGVVHGDAEALAGWSFAAERLSAISGCGANDATGPQSTPIAEIERYFRESQLDAFACTHTCLPYAHDYQVDGIPRLIINNGAAGLPNFANSRFGIITRITVDPRRPAASLYGIALGGVRFDALAVEYDQRAWLSRFLAEWPPGSPACEAYLPRILEGPSFALHDALGGHVCC